jgi:quercetin dioxygenase-like cupin family protein
LPRYNWKEVKLEQVNPQFSRRIIAGEKLMLAEISTKKGAVVPLHKHVHEQVSMMLEGRVKFIVGGKDHLVKGGDVLVIPSNVEHSAITLEDSLSIDIFTPLREDWLSGKDAYLRGPADAKKKK